jgi:hypothetical protein
MNFPPRLSRRKARHLEAPVLPEYGRSRSWMVWRLSAILFIVGICILVFERSSWGYAGILVSTFALVLFLIFLVVRQRCSIVFGSDHLIIIDPLNFPGRKRIYFSEIDFYARTVRRSRGAGFSYKIIGLYRENGRRIGIISESQPGWSILKGWFKRHFPERSEKEIGGNVFIQLWNYYS